MPREMPVRDVMTTDGLITAPVGVNPDNAIALFAQHKIEKLPLVDEEGKLRGLITVKDFDKSEKYPNATKDSEGRLRVGAALGFFGDAWDRAVALNEAGAVVGMLSSTDLIVRESRVHLPTVVTILGATIELPSQKRRFDEDLEKALGSTVAEVMGDDVHTVGPDDTVETAATLMHEHNVSRLPVVDDEGHLVGIIARGDILRAVVQAGK